MDDIASRQVQSDVQCDPQPAGPARGYRFFSTLAELPEIGRGLARVRKRAPGGTAFVRFRQDRYFLLRYYLANLLVLGGGIILCEAGLGHLGGLEMPGFWLIGLMLFVLPSFALIFLSGLYYLLLVLIVQPASVPLASVLLVPVGMLAGTVSAALMHNAAHGNFPRPWMNRAVGEACGLFQLTGFAGWCISHFIHHGAPDDPARDAHPPGDLGFATYMNAMGRLMKENLTAAYFEIHGVDRHARATWTLVGWLLPFVRYARIAFVLALLGPTLFVMLYVPFKITNTLIYGDFNYRTHRPTADGGYEILNLDHNVWYRFLNAVSFGCYYHKNHHRRPNVFDPRAIEDDGRPLVTWRH